jgi:hypothetical protein
MPSIAVTLEAEIEKPMPGLCHSRSMSSKSQYVFGAINVYPCAVPYADSAAGRCVCSTSFADVKTSCGPM